MINDALPCLPKLYTRKGGSLRRVGKSVMVNSKGSRASNMKSTKTGEEGKSVTNVKVTTEDPGTSKEADIATVSK